MIIKFGVEASWWKLGVDSLLFPITFDVDVIVHIPDDPGWCRYSCFLSSVQKLSTSSIALRRYRPFREGRAFDMNLQILQWIAGR